MRKVLEGLATASIVLAAVVVAGLAVHRHFFQSGPAAVRGSLEAPVRQESVLLAEEDWAGLLQAGTIDGDPDAPVLIAVFSDLQCPYCRRFHFAFEEIERSLGADVALVVIHYPLRSHALARPAAYALECAGIQSRFREFLNLSYREQDAIGIKPFERFALEAGVPDTSAFKRCLAEDGVEEPVRRGRAWAEKLELTGTPTVVINGWLLPRPPYTNLASVVDSIVSEEGPFGQHD